MKNNVRAEHMWSILLGVAVLVLSLATPASAGLYDAWNYSATIQFSGYSKPETLNNFPALVVLNSANVSGFDYSQFLSGSNADLRFTDSTGLVDLNYEVEKWDVNGSSYVWVQVPAIADASSSVVAYWGANGQLAPISTTNGATWNADYRGVWHMDAVNATDSTGNRFNGTGSGNTNATGVIGTGQGFNGVNTKYVSLSSSVGSGVNAAITVEAWALLQNASGNYRAVVSERYNGDGNVQYALYAGQGKASGGFFDGAWRQVSEGTAWPLNQWQHVVSTYDGHYIRVYRNGVQVAVSGDQARSLPTGVDGRYLGHRHDNVDANDTWNNAKNGQYFLDPANWIPAGQFLNLFGEICDINAGGYASCGEGGFVVVNFSAQLNLNSNATLSGGSYRTVTYANLHLRGGTMVGQSCGTFYGHYFVDNASVIDLRDAGDGVKMFADFSGSGNLCVSNGLISAGRYTWWPLLGNSPNYSGVWTFYNTWVGRLYFDGNLGSGGLNFTPMSSNICINVNTACPWTMDLRGAQVQTGVTDWPDGGTANPIHSGTFTLLSDVIIRAGGWGDGLLATINGRITGPGRLGTRALSEQRPGAGNTIKLGGANDYSGGTVVITNILEAAAATCLGTGNVEIQPGGILQVDVSATMNPSARLYLDNSGASQGVMNLGASTSVLTTVSRAYIGGTGGWRAPSGYTELAPGIYTNGSAGVSGYFGGSGKLKVSPPPGTIMLFR